MAIGAHTAIHSMIYPPHLSAHHKPAPITASHAGTHRYQYGHAGAVAAASPSALTPPPTAEDAWLRRECPRIIDEALASAVDARRADRSARYLRATNGRLIGRPATGATYLLSGLLMCPCGARFEALKGGNWSHRGAVYVCAARRRKGPSVCTNRLALPIAETDDRILRVVEDDVLSPYSSTGSWTGISRRIRTPTSARPWRPNAHVWRERSRT